MTYNTEILKTFSEKEFLAVIKPAIRIETWTLQSGTVYYADFQVSDELTEYVYAIEWNGVSLDSVSNSPASGEFYFDYTNRRIYINNGSDPNAEFITVFFEFFVATKTINTYRKPMDSSTTVVYYAPKIRSATIPQINNEDLLLFGSYSGNISLINTDGSFYVYESASFRRKDIEIYHIVNGIDNIKLVYSGSIENITKNDSDFTLNYRQIDFIFNKNFSSSDTATNDISKGFFSVDEFPLLDQRFDGYAIRAIYGVVDDILPVNVDYNATIGPTVNRDWIVRNLASQSPSINLTVQAGTTTTRVYCGVNHGLFAEESVVVKVLGVDNYCYITAKGSNYVDVSPALSGVPTTGVDTIRRGTIGNIFIKDENGTIFRLFAVRDYNEQTFTGVSGDMNCYGFVLTDNFESFLSGFTGYFNPESHKIFCRCYGIRGNVADIDPEYRVITNANMIIESILTYYLKLDSTKVNSTAIKALSLPSVGFSIPEQLSTTTPTYREILNKIMVSSLSQLYFDSDFKLNLREIAPLGSATYTVTDSDLLSFAIDYTGDDIYELIRLFYAYKEAPSGSDRSSHRRVISQSNLAKYLHKEENQTEIYTDLLRESEAQQIADHYAIILGDWARSYSFKTKTQLINALIGDVIEISRTRLDGYNLNKKTLRQKLLKITGIKKDINSIEFSADPQKNIQDNIGGW